MRVGLGTTATPLTARMKWLKSWLIWKVLRMRKWSPCPSSRSSTPPTCPAPSMAQGGALQVVRLVQQPLPQSEHMRAGHPKKDIKRIKDRELMTATEKEENDIFAERKCPYCPFTIYNERPERKKSVSGQWSMDNVYFTLNGVLDTWFGAGSASSFPLSVQRTRSSSKLLMLWKV